MNALPIKGGHGQVHASVQSLDSAVDSSGRYDNFSAGGDPFYTCQSKSLVLVLRDHKMASITQMEMLFELKLFDII